MKATRGKADERACRNVALDADSCKFWNHEEAVLVNRR